MTAPAADLMLPAAGIGVWEGARVRMDDSTLDTDHGVVFEPATEGRWWVTFPRHRLSAAGPDHREIGLSRMSLDLTHRPTRSEVLARLAERVGVDAQAAVVWVCDRRGFWCLAAGACAVEPARSACSAQIDAAFSRAGRAFLRVLWWPRHAGWPEWDQSERRVEALAGLDHTDDTRLSDGARRVDVRALAIVAASVFGSASSRPG